MYRITNMWYTITGSIMGCLIKILKNLIKREKKFQIASASFNTDLIILIIRIANFKKLSAVDK